MDKEIEEADFPMTQKSGENLLFSLSTRYLVYPPAPTIQIATTNITILFPIIILLLFFIAGLHLSKCSYYTFLKCLYLFFIQYFRFIIHQKVSHKIIYSFLCCI